MKVNRNRTILAEHLMMNFLPMAAVALMEEQGLTTPEWFSILTDKKIKYIYIPMHWIAKRFHDQDE